MRLRRIFGVIILAFLVSACTLRSEDDYHVTTETTIPTRVVLTLSRNVMIVMFEYGDRHGRQGLADFMADQVRYTAWENVVCRSSSLCTTSSEWLRGNRDDIANALHDAADSNRCWAHTAQGLGAGWTNYNATNRGCF